MLDFPYQDSSISCPDKGVAIMAFRCFPELPLELRQQIWELGMEPREVVFGPPHYYVRRSSTPAPTLLQVCRESRAYLHSHYHKCQSSWNPEKFRFINFDIDTAYCAAVLSPVTAIQIAPVQRLKIEFIGTIGGVFFFHFLHLFKSLKTVTIIYRDSCLERNDNWEMLWLNVMRTWYHGDEPVRFYATVIYLNCPVIVPLTRDNWFSRQLIPWMPGF